MEGLPTIFGCSMGRPVGGRTGWSGWPGTLPAQ